jgi:hypothetical protein
MHELNKTDLMISIYNDHYYTDREFDIKDYKRNLMFEKFEESER